MPGTNQFLPFAVGAGANTLTPTAYAALTSLLSSGFVAGVAPSAQFNTALRQATTAAAGVAQFAANQGVNVNDDGSPSNFATSLLTALQVLFLGMSSFTGSNVLQAPTGYLRLPGGLVIQWGGYSGGGFGPTMTFPLAFPTQCFAVVACSSNGGNSTAESVSVTSLTRFSFLARQVQSTGVSSAFYWIAIGV